jgi:hypothetical protein
MSRENPQGDGYNYGRPIDLGKPAGFDSWQQVADDKRNAAVLLSNDSWKADAVLRDIRIATTAQQWNAAVYRATVYFTNTAPPRYHLGDTFFDQLATIGKRV